jgi:3-hydroxymyristoyl/3-hydroxydecanoyl-(acyl carrier protein) dehydratase
MQAFEFSFDSGHPAFAGHFPGRPIVPGVLLLDQAKRTVESASGLNLGGLAAVKFLSPAGPGDVLSMQYEITEAEVRFTILCAQRKVAEGRFVIARGEGS